MNDPLPVSPFQRLRRDPRARFGGGILFAIILLCIMGPGILPHDANTQTTGLGATGPLERLHELRPTNPDDQGMPPMILTTADLRTVSEGARAYGINPFPVTDGPGYWIEPSVFYIPPSGQRLPPAWIPLQQWSESANTVANALGVELPPGALEPENGTGMSIPGVAAILPKTIQPLPQRHLLGTDPLGRDLLQRILVGGRLSLAVGLCATLVAVGIGVFYGGIAGYVGGRIDSLMMRFVDAVYAIPFVIFVILLVMIFDRNLLLLFAAIGAVEWLTMARIVRGQVMALKHRPFVEAARVSGASPARILCHHILPNCIGVIIVYATLTVPTVILLESVLSFLGLGVPPPSASWGVLIEEGAERVRTDPWLLIAPASFFAITLLALNTVGDALRDAFVPERHR